MHCQHSLRSYLHPKKKNNEFIISYPFDGPHLPPISNHQTQLCSTCFHAKDAPTEMLGI